MWALRDKHMNLLLFFFLDQHVFELIEFSSGRNEVITSAVRGAALAFNYNSWGQLPGLLFTSPSLTTISAQDVSLTPSALTPFVRAIQDIFSFSLFCRAGRAQVSLQCNWLIKRAKVWIIILPLLLSISIYPPFRPPPTTTTPAPRCADILCYLSLPLFLLWLEIRVHFRCLSCFSHYCKSPSFHAKEPRQRGKLLVLLILY